MKTPRCSLPDLPAVALARRRRQAPALTKWNKRNLSWRWAGLSWGLGVMRAAKMNTCKPRLKRQDFVLLLLEIRSLRSRGGRVVPWRGYEGESGLASIHMLQAALGPWLQSLLPSPHSLL